ncbi:MAG: nitroreductase family protein [Acidimicrobiia bacterium]
MEFADVVRRRRMVRSFERRPVDPTVLRTILEAATRAPSAGNTQGWSFVVLEGPDETARFWDATLPPERRAGFTWPGLLDAPVIVLPLADGAAYVARYGEPDKVRSGLGEGTDRWPVPYWVVDTSFATMTLLHAVVDAGLGALFFGVFHGEAELRRTLAIPDSLTLIGAIALGHPKPSRAGRSATRSHRPIDEVVHRGRFSSGKSDEVLKEEANGTIDHQ